MNIPDHAVSNSQGITSLQGQTPTRREPCLFGAWKMTMVGWRYVRVEFLNLIGSAVCVL